MACLQSHALNWDAARMSSHSPADARFEIEAAPPTAPEEMLLASRDLGDGTRQTDLSVPGMRCGGCMAAVERTLAALEGVANARVNLSTKRVAVRWHTHRGAAPDLIGALERIGYPAHLFSFETDAKDPELSRLLKALAVAGFCAMNIMLLSVSVWSGADEERGRRFISFRPRWRFLPYSIPEGSSICRRGRRCATAGRTWTCQSRSV